MIPDVCPCEPMPVNYWCMPTGEWIAAEQLSETSDPIRDGELYNRLGCVAWVIACPECHRIYTQGVSWPRTY